ncbi:MAG: InlB B-repeat-containing protein, partial [Kiritimatiellae bacterium]|nr:InlB B-repeat-containing protein [Kiritimatiellia bacterium]
MNKAMRMGLVLAAAVLGAAGAWAGDSAPMVLDTRDGTRIASEGVAERIALSGRWYGAAATVTADGKVIATAAAGEEKTVSWTPSGEGRHVLRHVSGGETLEAGFTVLGDGVALHACALSSSETWESGKVHLVTAAVTVPSGVTLTIQPGAVVKFLDGASLAVASGGACIARGVVFTHIADDTAGGDTLMDGDGSDGSPGTARPTMGAYTITGTVTDDEATEYRYLPPQALASSISSDTRLRGHRCYIASNSVTVASGATLTLQPGTVLKFAAGCQLTVNGTLDARGTRATPIVFTSLKDDEHGGDSNGDGDKTAPAGGNWNGIWVYGRADLAHCEAMYAGNGNERGIVQVQSSGVLTMDACTIAHALNDGVWNWGGTIAATNCIFTDLGWATAPYRGTKNEYVNCVFFGNNVGLCYWSHWTGAPVYRNCIFSECAHGWCELASGSYGAPPSGVSVSHCDFWNPAGYGVQSCALAGSNGNVWGDPLFEDADNGDFRLSSAASPCVDAADTAKAPETDFYGQERLTVRYAPTGTPDALGRHGDIGLHEFLPENAAGLYDLAAVAVAASATSAAPGETIAVSWTVGNAGKRAVPDAWHDALALVSIATGRAYPLGEPLNPGVLDAGAERTFTGSFAVPVVPEGAYRLRLTVNSRRSEVPEGASTGNNAVLSDATVAVAIPAAAASDGADGRVAAGTSAAVAFSVPAGSGDLLLRVSAPAGGGAVSGRVGLGHLPSDAASGTALVFADGEAWLMVPAGTETVWLVLDNGGAAEAAYTADFRAGSLSLASVSPAALPASGKVTLKITGAGFTDACTVKVGGVSASSVRCVGESLLSATVDCGQLAAGSRVAVTVAKGAETKTLADALAVSAAAGEGKFWAKLSVPESVREGRLVQTCAIEYGNSGMADMASPVLQVAMEGNGTLGYIGGLQGQTALQFVAAGDAGSAGILRPGETHRIRFALRAGSSNRISLHSSVGSTYAPAPWTGAAAYLADLSAAATRIGLRGADATDYEEVFSLAKAVKAGTNCAVICGRISDADGSPLPGVCLSFTDQSSGTVLSAVSDVEGRFATGTAVNGNYAIACAGVPLGEDSMETSVSDGKDTVLSLAAADGGTRAVVAVKGGTEGLTAIATLIEDGTAYAGREVDGGFEFRGLPEGPYRVQIFRGENDVFFGRFYAKEGTSVARGLEYDGSLPGTLVLSTDTESAAAGAGFVVVSDSAGCLRIVMADEETAAVEVVLPSGSYTVGLVVAGDTSDTSVCGAVTVMPEENSALHLEPNRGAEATAAFHRGAAAKAPGEDAQLKLRMRAAWNKAVELEAVPLNPPTGDRDCIHNREGLYPYYKGYRNEYLKVKSDFRKVFLDYEEAEKAYRLQDSIFKLDVLVTAVAPFLGVVGAVGISALKDVLEMAYHQQLSFEAFKAALEESGIPGVTQGIKVTQAYSLIRDFCQRQVLQTQFELHKAAMLNKNLPAMELSNQRFEQFLINNDYYAYWECCPMVFPETPYQPPVEATQPKVPQSWDPNEMAGPEGTGADRALLAGEAYEWTIYFENKTNATAAAAEVRVTERLSPQLDWKSFEMVEVSFGETTDVGLAGKANGTSETNLAGTAWTVRTEVALDTTNGVVQWYSRVVDPEGDEDGWPLDPTAGFLPPNDATHRGEGHITYRVKVKANAAENARIDAAATIVFDSNDPIPTDPAWWNTVAWRSYTVKFAANGGTGSMANQRIRREAAAKLSANKFARSGHVFMGWAKTKTGAVAYANGASVKNLAAAGKSVTLYARWAKKNYKVAFNGNGGKLPRGKKMPPQTMTYGKAAKLRANLFTRSGYVFAGWAKTKAGAVAYANGATVKN